jgi:alkanesulfonate monooxygenase SsuD/methylene tetrahydromethanopterin reductase-like flavin-dependent oxidoreductase (luciferase family)
MTRKEQHQAGLAEEQQQLARAARQVLERFFHLTKTEEERENFRALRDLFAKWERSGQAQRCLQLADELHQAALFASLEGHFVPGWDGRVTRRQWTDALDEIIDLRPLARDVAGIPESHMAMLVRARARLRRPKKGEAGPKTWRGIFQESVAITTHPHVRRELVRLMLKLLERLAPPTAER